MTNGTEPFIGTVPEPFLYRPTIVELFLVDFDRSLDEDKVVSTRNNGIAQNFIGNPTK